MANDDHADDTRADDASERRLTTADAPDIAIVHGTTHGMPAADYAAALRERLPALRIAVARTPAEAREFVAEAPVVTGTSIDEELLARAEALRWFACASAGYEHLPLDALAERDVVVTNASGIHAPNIAEQVLGKLLLFVRRLHVGLRRTRRHEWRHFQADELRGSTVTVVGLGSIGTAVAERLEAFGVERLGVRHSPEKGGPVEEVFGYDEIHEALARTDYLVLACPLTETTQGLIDAAALETLPPEAVLVNVARGGVVDTDALVAALRDNALAGAALDVTDPEPLPEDHPLWTFENVVITPHNAGHSPHLYDRLAAIVARNVERIREGGYEDLENQVLP